MHNTTEFTRVTTLYQILLLTATGSTAEHMVPKRMAWEMVNWASFRADPVRMVEPELSPLLMRNRVTPACEGGGGGEV